MGIANQAAHRLQAPLFGILAIRHHQGRRRIVDAGCIARCHGSLGIEYGGQPAEFLDGTTVPDSLVDQKGHFVPLDLDLDRNDLRFEEPMVDRGAGAPMAFHRQRVLIFP